MTDKMVRFLKSIGIENIDDFDIDFISCQKSKVDKNFFIFNPVKNKKAKSENKERV